MDLVHSAHLQGLKTRSAEDAAARLERLQQHALRMTEARVLEPPPGYRRVVPDADALARLPRVDIKKPPLYRDNAPIRMVQCPRCFEAGITVLLCGSKDVIHKRTSVPPGQEPIVTTRSDLWHIALGTPMDLLFHCPDRVELLNSTDDISYSPGY